MKKMGNQKKIGVQHVRRSYVTLSIMSVVAMIIVAYITYGYHQREMQISFGNNKETQQKNHSIQQKGTVSIGADLSNIPKDDVIDDILNDVLPHTCKNCNKEPLDCLKSYEINKIIVQNVQHQNHLFIKLITGKKEQKVYTVVIDLANNNHILQADGAIDKKRCREVITSEDIVKEEYDVMLDKGEDPQSSHYVTAE